MLKGVWEEDSVWLFSVMPSDRATGKTHSLKWRRFCLNITKYIFIVSVTKPWNRLPKVVMESPSLKILKSHWDMSWAAGSRWLFLSREDGPDDFQGVSSNPDLSVILLFLLRIESSSPHCSYLKVTVKICDLSSVNKQKKTKKPTKCHSSQIS